MTAFYDPQDKVTFSSWWHDILNCEPETKFSRTKGEIQKEEGAFGKGTLSLAVQPFRIDWIYIRTPYHESPSGGIPTLGSFPNELDKFIQLMQKWFALKTCPATILRLAFGAVLLQPVESLRQGYELLAEYLKKYVKLDVEDSSDFLYSINRSKNSVSVAEDLRINRLSKWSVASLKTVGFSIAPTPLKFVSEPEQFVCRLELDINTFADFTGKFSPEKLLVIFQELVELGKEIAEKGDIK
jgi:hypothetical protein